ncbi:hypothetical protein CYMTET_37995 [Cymbomonas tetramitiformis]|uniref:Prolyl 4-hydroxylase alpha subunit domain-containing protein n=1 Tax=Cymbomonas tetramitiformis TaxID=36881 RepID=A0AAE0CED1_9CHLO|nr:hypothetical protein CYMTET_37995 [Cymbomonas tetramitiformis]
MGGKSKVLDTSKNALKGGPRAPDGGVDVSKESEIIKQHFHIFGKQHVKQDSHNTEFREVREMVPDQTGFIVAISNLLSASECAKLRETMEGVGLNVASQADLNPRKNEAYVDRESLTFRDAALENVLCSRLAPLMPQVEGREFVGFLPRWRYYIYRKGQSFGKHVDVATKGSLPGEETEYTLLVYLNGQGECDLEGGETIFWATARKVLCEVSPQTGMCLLHAHGRRCLLHEGALVRKGTKYVLRTDVMYRRISS